MSVQTERTADDGDSSSSTEADAGTSISKDDAFHILQNSRRRAVLRYLAAHDEEERFVMRDLAEEVAAWEHDTTVQQLVSDERQRVYIALYQSHLPKLDDHDIIEYNQSRGVVEPTELVDALAPYLDEGLHSDTDLTVEAESESTEAEGESITETVSALFSR
ncbi:DUF7344 domain-containing protein [Haloglomus halophilum]|uniref:DUF7344 domain-containing protein n=1 Tax=Haloglomus halophilum TaxID=2962672 RepID=UPI0020C99323|nr:hypothetical protein [Haloglomus halophilum]